MLTIKYVMNALKTIFLTWMDSVTTVKLTTVMNAQEEIKIFAQIVWKVMDLVSLLTVFLYALLAKYKIVHNVITITGAVQVV